MSNNFFPAPKTPRIYAYSDSHFPNCLKVGFTERSVQERMGEHYPTKLPQQPYTVLLDELAIRNDGSFFKDHDVHKILKRNRKVTHRNGEWFECNLDDVKAAVLEIKTGKINSDSRTLIFGMRPEQQAAVLKPKTNGYTPPTGIA